MDILKDKSYKSNDSYISRYENFPFYYNIEDNKYIYGLTSQLKKDLTYTTIKLKPGDTLDFLANKYYGRPDYYWVIADFNNIQDPFINLLENFSEIKLPSIANLEFED